jgi:hypothetical protein
VIMECAGSPKNFLWIGSVLSLTCILILLCNQSLFPVLPFCIEFPIKDRCVNFLFLRHVLLRLSHCNHLDLIPKTY